MIPESSVIAVLHDSGASRLDKVLTILASEADGPKPVVEIKKLGGKRGLRGIQKWNVSDILGRSGGAAIHTGSGWEITDQGRTRALRVAAVDSSNGTDSDLASDLKTAAKKIRDVDSRNFVEEAIACYENRLHRSAVVLSWVGAVAVLQDEVLARHLPAFNAEAKRRYPKWKNANDRDGLARMQEFDFLQLLEALSIISKNSKHELEHALKSRNGCGHPNSVSVRDRAVAAHLEQLLLGVYVKFQ